MPGASAERLSPYFSDHDMVATGLVASLDEAATTRRRAKAGKWAKGASGNPAGRPAGTPNKATALRAAFTDAKAEAVLDLLFIHAVNDPATARWLAARIYGEGVWNPIVPPEQASTPEACAAALDGAVDTHLRGEINARELAHLIATLQARLDRLARQASATIPE